MSSGPSKTEEISLVLSEPDVDLWKLRELALTEGGLINDTLRKRAWPKLVGLHGSFASSSTMSDLSGSKERGRAPRPPRPVSEEKEASVVEGDVPIVSMTPSALPPSGRKVSRLQPVEGEDDASIGSSISDSSSAAMRKKTDVVAECLDADQIQRDVARCTWHLLTGSQRSRRAQMKNKNKKKMASLLRRKQRRLGNLINLTLIRSYQNVVDDEDRLRYYQGYHDVACIFLSSLGGGTMISSEANNSNGLEATAVAMGLDLPSRVLLQVSQSHFRDAMRSNFLQLQSALRLVLFPLIGAFDSQVHSFLWDCEMEPYFALSWIITWFSHDIRDTTLVKRLFDAFLVSHPLFSLYLSVAMVLHPTNRIDVLSAEWGDFACVHQTLAGLPKNSCSVGWKYKVGDGYVSGDEEEDDGATQSTDMDISIMSEDVVEGLVDDATSESQSMISSNLMHVGSNTRVPFQELIDMAISFMRRIPPRNLVKLAHRYHFEDENLLARSSSIALLQPPPSWGLVSTTPSDWVLKQRARESRGMSATTRKDRKRRRQPPRAAEDDAEPEEAQKAFEREDATRKYLEEKKKTLAVIASGFGPGDDEERRWRRRKKLMLQASIVVAVVAVAYGLTLQYRPDLLGRSIEADTPRDSDTPSVTRNGRGLLKNAAGALKSVTRRAQPETFEKPHAQGQMTSESASTNFRLKREGSVDGPLAAATKKSSGIVRGENESTRRPPTILTGRRESTPTFSLMPAVRRDETDTDTSDSARAMKRLITQIPVDGTPDDSLSPRKSDSVVERAVRFCQAAASLTSNVFSRRFWSSLWKLFKEMKKNAQKVIEEASLKP